MLDAIRARESETLIHHGGKRSLQALPRYFGFLKLGRKPTEDGGEQKPLKLHQPLRCRFSLSALQRFPVSGDTEQKYVYVYGEHRQSELLDTPRQSGLSVTAVGPGRPALIGPSWHTLLH